MLYTTPMAMAKHANESYNFLRKKMKYKIFFEQGDRHDATIHYVNIIKKALEIESGEDVLIVDNIKQIEKTEIVVVVNAKAHLKLLLKNR